MIATSAGCGRLVEVLQSLALRLRQLLDALARFARGLIGLIAG